jgi:predicted DNA-binding transcriptional regulator AlpA
MPTLPTETKPLLLKTQEVATMLAISRQLLRRMIKRGTFPKPIILAVGAWRWKLDDVNQWIEDRFRENMPGSRKR